MTDFLTSIFSTDGILVGTIAPFLLVLTIVVFVHEMGHYLVGRWCGIHAEVFSLGFGPVLVSGHDRRGTRWQLAAIPFGGYVKFLGDADASSKADEAAMAAMDAETRSRSFHGAELYKKALTVAAGPVSNFILSTVVFMGLAMAYGLATDRPTIGALKPLPGAAPDIASGDVILAVNGTATPGYLELFNYARAADPSVPQVYSIERGSDRLEREGPFPLLPVIESLTPRKQQRLLAAIYAYFEAQEIDAEDVPWRVDLAAVA